jgi:hypothetical protein
MNIQILIDGAETAIVSETSRTSVGEGDEGLDAFGPLIRSSTGPS